jgi:hypothetical protein
MNALENDFSSTTWRARPWDDPYSTYCGPVDICGDNEPEMLNVTKTTDDDGNETLVYDDVPYTVDSNGLIPDIPSLGDHILGIDALFADSDVIHKVYMKDADSSLYMTLEQVCDYDTAVAIQGDGDGELETTNPIFTSHQACGTIFTDYADGYACVSGNQPYAGEDLGRGIYGDVLDCLGVPGLGVTGQPSTLLFQCGSGILVESGLRLDCGCLLVGCDMTEEGETICSSDHFLDENNQYDWDCDHLRIEARLVAEEQFGTCSTQLTGEIPTLLETI